MVWEKEENSQKEAGLSHILTFAPLPFKFWPLYDTIDLEKIYHRFSS